MIEPDADDHHDEDDAEHGEELPKVDGGGLHSGEPPIGGEELADFAKDWGEEIDGEHDAGEHDGGEEEDLGDHGEAGGVFDGEAENGADGDARYKEEDETYEEGEDGLRRRGTEG